MNNQTFFLIIIILILIFFLPERQHRIKQQIKNRFLCRQNRKNDSQSNSNQNEQEMGQEIGQEKSADVINNYLGETKCEEGFDTMGNGLNIGNGMNFSQQSGKMTGLDKALEKSLVPDFEPNSLNINPDLNSYGYATNNNLNVTKGYINPNDANQYANSIQYDLSHPYQTRYCTSKY